MHCSSSWIACRQPTDMSQTRSASDLAGAHRCEMPARKRPGCRCRRRRVQIVQLWRPFSFFSASCARISQASAISSKRLPVLSAHLARDADAIRRVLPEFFRLPQPGLLSPRRGNADFWNFVLQQFCDVKLRGTIGPGRDFYRCVSGRVCCRFFPPSITVDMPRSA